MSRGVAVMDNLSANIDELCVNTIRFLAVDAVEQAKSGHPGMPMGAASVAYALWDSCLKHNPADPGWPDRDRFVLSAGHASMMLYSLLYLSGYDISLEDIKQFRQWGSKTPGHPEYRVTPGVEATTGPLGQGFGNAVGMAIAERSLAQRFNKPGHEIIDHFTYCIVSEGDMQEGVSSEAASLAGTLQLGKLICLFDENGISIEGNTRISFTEDVARRFQAYGWQVIGPVDGMNIDSVRSALLTAKSEPVRPSLITCKTIIGYGSPGKMGTGAAHGEPLGMAEAKLAKEKLEWHYPESFTVPEEVLTHMRQALDRGSRSQTEWEARLKSYTEAYPAEANQLLADLAGRLPDGWDSRLNTLFSGQTGSMSTREASGRILNAAAGNVRSLIGGSADLAPSTKTHLKGYGDFGPDDYAGRNLHFGIREHAMGAISNGMALHGGLIPYTGTFLVFYDYMRPPVRMAALMGIRIIFIFTHDSIGVGEDGPTHQPIEQLAGLRAVPGLVTIRPADATETVEAWKIAMERSEGPTAILLTRQNVPVLDRESLSTASGVRKGGYVLWESGGRPDVILIGTGSEVHIALEAAKILADKGVSSRIVSLPSWELFDMQPQEYKQHVLPREIKARVSIEAASTMGWERYVGLDGTAIGISRFGASAPGEVIYKKLGLTAQRVAEKAMQILRDVKNEEHLDSGGPIVGGG